MGLTAPPPAEQLIAGLSTPLAIAAYARLGDMLCHALEVAESDPAWEQIVAARCWLADALEARGEMDRLADADGVCRTCWAPLSAGGACPDGHAR